MCCAISCCGPEQACHLLAFQVKEILAYAAQRFIEVVPEIELPGHCGAALASYPYLGCRGNLLRTAAHCGVT